MSSFTGVLLTVGVFSSPVFCENPPYSACDWLVLVAFLAECVKFIADEPDWWKVDRVNDFKSDVVVFTRMAARL